MNPLWNLLMHAWFAWASLVLYLELYSCKQRWSCKRADGSRECGASLVPLYCIGHLCGAVVGTPTVEIVRCRIKLPLIAMVRTGSGFGQFHSVG
jgi:hypothetical protein